MRIRTILRLAIAAVIAAAVLLVALQFDAVAVLGRNALSAVGIGRSRRIESSRIVLEEVREIYELSTIEYVYRTVFPYDFMDPSISIATIMQSLRGAQGSLESLLSPRELEYFRAHNLSREAGLGTDNFEFLVITVVVGAGYSLADTVLASPGALGAESIEAAVSMEEEIVDGRVERRITLPLPEPSITYILIEDRDTSSYPYPDVNVQPDEWRRIAEFVSERVAERTIADGILEAAAERGRNAIRSLLLEAGFDEVTFRPL